MFGCVVRPHECLMWFIIPYKCPLIAPALNRYLLTRHLTVTTHKAPSGPQCGGRLPVSSTRALPVFLCRSTTPFASSATMPGAITITACATSTPLVYAGGASSAGTSLGCTGAIGGASGTGVPVSVATVESSASSRPQPPVGATTRAVATAPPHPPRSRRHPPTGGASHAARAASAATVSSQTS